MPTRRFACRAPPPLQLHSWNLRRPLRHSSMFASAFQYPVECKSDLAGNEPIGQTDKNLELLNRVDRGVNAAIIPVNNGYNTSLEDGWTIAPAMGDCNDYAVTKRHELLQSGLPANALRLAMVKTGSGVGHLVLLVATTNGDLVLDNLTEAIVTWRNTDYHWLKIQIKASGDPPSQARHLSASPGFIVGTRRRKPSGLRRDQFMI